MTSTSRAAFQNGALALPTQWLSYTFRAMESIVLGRGFTGSRERSSSFHVDAYVRSDRYGSY